MEPLGGLLCAKHFPIGKEWGWDEEFAQHKMFATDLQFSVLGSPAAAAPCLEAHTIQSPKLTSQTVSESGDKAKSGNVNLLWLASDLIPCSSLSLCFYS